MANSQTPQPEEDLSLDWETLRGSPVVAPEPTFPDRNPGDFILGTSTGRVILRITREGRVELGPGVDLDEAAELFWTNLALKRQGMEERLLHLGIMEALLIQLGEADIAYERAQLRTQTPEATPHDGFMAEMARRSLESRVHSLLDFSRGLVRRPDPPTPIPETPTETVSTG